MKITSKLITSATLVALLGLFPAKSRGDSADRIEADILEITSTMKQQHKEPIASWPGSATSQPKIQQLAEILCTNSEVRDKDLFTKRSGQLEEGTPDNQKRGLVFSNSPGPAISWETEIKTEAQPYEQQRTLYSFRCTYNNMNWYIFARYMPLPLWRCISYGDLNFQNLR